MTPCNILQLWSLGSFPTPKYSCDNLIALFSVSKFVIDSVIIRGIFCYKVQQLYIISRYRDSRGNYCVTEMCVIALQMRQSIITIHFISWISLSIRISWISVGFHENIITRTLVHEIHDYTRPIC